MKSREFFNIIDNKQPNNSISNAKTHQLFRRSLLPQQDRGRGRSSFFSYHKTTTDWATELVSQNLNLSSSVYPVPVLSMQEYPKIHNLVKNLFPAKISPGLPLAERVKHLAKKCEKLTKDPAVLNKVHGYQIPFIEHTYQLSLTHLS